MYIGNQEIIEKHDLDDLYVEVTLSVPEGEKRSKIEKEIFSKKMLSTIETEVPIDDTLLREMRTRPVTNGIVALLADYNIYLDAEGGELDYIIRSVLQDLEAIAKTATEKKWGVPAWKVNMKHYYDQLK